MATQSDIFASIFSLAKSNNGFFKSEKQASFLSSILQQFDGHIGHTDSGYNTCAVFAECDKQGVTKIYKTTKAGDVVMFERKTAGKLTVQDAKALKYYERQAKQLSKLINDKQNAFSNGTYSKSGLPYSLQTIETYTTAIAKDRNQLAALLAKIADIKNSINNILTK